MSRAAGAGALDPFGTAGLREVVLHAWAASPARFREDANAEERLAIGYGGRVVAELAANGADAARAAGVPGEIAVTVIGRELRIANTGAPLTADGVAALAALRASAKRDDDGVGHFGVGFTAVRALTDDPVIVSTAGGVRFSAADTARAVAELDVPGLDAEVRRRGGQLPALRLPWPLPPARPGSDDGPPPGFVTEVRLPLRADVDAGALSAALGIEAALDLLWALPDLTAVTVPGHRVDRDVTLADGTTTIRISAPSESDARARAGARREASGSGPGGELRRFRTVTAAGVLPPDLLADRPVEERGRDRWQLGWILPLGPDGRPDPLRRSVIGAPTPTEEPLGLPARLVGTLPVEESRSRIASGPLADHLLDAAADAYTDLVLAVPGTDRIALIPGGGFPLGEADATLHRAITARLQRTRFLPGADGTPVSPAQATLVAGLSGPAAGCVAEALPGLLAWPDSPAQVERLRSLGVRVRPVSDVTAALAGLDRPPVFWRTVYDALADAPLEELTDLPVPRVGGGTVVGPRGMLLPTAQDSGARVAAAAADGGGLPVGLADRAAELVPGLRMAAVDHPLLRRLGAEPADATALLADGAMTGEIRRRLDDLDRGDEDPDPDDLHEFAGLVLDLLAAGGSGDTALLAGVLLTDTDDEAWPAGSLLLPGAPLSAVLAADADLPVVGDAWVAGWGADTLAALGVRSGFGVRRYAAPPDEGADLADVDDWWDEIGAAASAADPVGGATFDAVPDLDLVADDAWPAALALLAAHRETRDAVRRTAFGPSYTGWWLARHSRVEGVRLTAWRTADAADLVALYDELPVTLPPDMAADIGVLGSLAQAASEPRELLRRWADAGRAVPPGRVAAITAALVAALADRPDLDLPDGVRSLAGTVVPADRAAVLDVPQLAQVIDPALLVAGGADPAAVADVLDLPLASERHAVRVVTGRSAEPTRLAALPEAARALAACGRADLDDLPVTVAPGLAVAGDGGEPRRVTWWPDGELLLIDGSAEGVGRAVAHLAGRWADRYRLVAAARGDAVAQAEAGLD